MQLNIEKSKFSEFSLDEIREALQVGLSKNYKDVEVVLICSTTFSSGVIFDGFKFSDWGSIEGYTTTMSFRTFQPN